MKKHTDRPKGFITRASKLAFIDRLISCYQEFYQEAAKLMAGRVVEFPLLDDNRDPGYVAFRETLYANKELADIYENLIRLANFATSRFADENLRPPVVILFSNNWWGWLLISTLADNEIPPPLYKDPVD